MKRKNILPGILILVVFMLNIIPLHSKAANPTLRVSSTVGFAGETVFTSVYVENNPGIGLIKLKLDFDTNILLPLAIEKGEVFESGNFFSVENFSTKTTTIPVLWHDTYDATSDGTLFTVQFLIRSSKYEKTTISIRYEPEDIINQALQEIYFDTISGVISKSPNDMTPDPTPTPSAKPTPESTPGSSDQTTDEDETTNDVENEGGKITYFVPSASGGGYTATDNPNRLEPDELPELADDGAGVADADGVDQDQVRDEDETNTQFEDINDYEWAKEEIISLAARGIIKGTSSSTFSPEENIKRADFMLLLVRLLNVSDVEFSENFDDVTPNDYYYTEIGMAKQIGLTDGTGDNLFEPELPISRQDLFLLAYRVLKNRDNAFPSELTDVDISEFNDADLVSDYAVEALETLVRCELVKGFDNEINPLGNATRAETAVFVYRLASLVD